jgi:hypothetical protein
MQMTAFWEKTEESNLHTRRRENLKPHHVPHALTFNIQKLRTSSDCFPKQQDEVFSLR